MNFDTKTIDELSSALIKELKVIYAAGQPIGTGFAAIPNIAKEGREISAVVTLWREITGGSSHLASPFMMGHMDTAPHPVAAMTDALVSALNNNLLFRELSPLVSQVEEQLVDFFAETLGLAKGATGTFVSGGSLANLTALFAACGGYPEAGESRADIRLILPENAHASIKKSVAVLGIGPDQIIVPESDDQGRLLPETLEESLGQQDGRRCIVVANLGSTIHGAVDNIAALGRIAKTHDAWFHVDAIYGAALAFSHKHRGLASGLEQADSLVAGPQKWMYTPRLSSMIFLKDPEFFDEALGIDLPYSVSGEQHRGKWGIQGSRRADALTLWMTLQAMGTDGIGTLVDRSIDMTHSFHDLMSNSARFEPSHKPDLNLQCFRVRRDADAAAIQNAHRALTEAGGPWVSLSSWRGELLFRAVLLSPATELMDLEDLLKDLARFLP